LHIRDGLGEFLVSEFEFVNVGDHVRGFGATSWTVRLRPGSRRHSISLN
jgi:hypothetical protein